MDLLNSYAAVLPKISEKSYVLYRVSEDTWLYKSASVASIEKEKAIAESHKQINLKKNEAKLLVT